MKSSTLQSPELTVSPQTGAEASHSINAATTAAPAHKSPGRRALRRMWERLLIAMSMPIILSEFFDDETGKDYGVSFFTKLKLVYVMAGNRKRVTTGSHFLEHLLMASEILKVPKSVPGCVVECGSYKGGSATNLSLVCDLTGRKLEIFDSFAGLPAPEQSDKEHVLVGLQTIHTYEEGAWCGTLPEVRQNITAHGRISVCNFNPGFFDQSLPSFKQPCVLVFADVDLRSSLETCIEYLWPRLQNSCCFFTHEAPHLEISALFYDYPWWQAHLNSSAPGLLGAGMGVGLLPESGGYRSDLGYAVKNPAVESYVEDPQTGARG
jgi:O-methyltransferase